MCVCVVCLLLFYASVCVCLTFVAFCVCLPAIVGECLPYISQRLLTDPSPRVAGALNTFVFGPEKHSKDRVLDAERLELIIDGFSRYANTASGELGDGNGAASSSGDADFAASGAAPLTMGNSYTPAPVTNVPLVNNVSSHFRLLPPSVMCIPVR